MRHANPVVVRALRLTPDFINGAFEFLGSAMIWRNVYQLYLDKMVRGVHWLPVGFFAAWGFWNLFYYPHLDQWWSFAGGVSIVIANVVWVIQILYYGRNGAAAR